MMDLLHTESLTIHVVTAGLPDLDGVAADTFTDRSWGPCNVQQKSSSEDRARGEVITTTWWVSGPLAQWISSGDKVTRDGREYLVEGEPAHFVAGALDHTEVKLIGWEGV